PKRTRCGTAASMSCSWSTTTTWGVVFRLALKSLMTPTKQSERVSELAARHWPPLLCKVRFAGRERRAGLAGASSFRLQTAIRSRCLAALPYFPTNGAVTKTNSRACYELEMQVIEYE